MKAELDLNLPAGAKAPSMARRFLQGLRDHVSPDCHDIVELLVSELVTNSFRHAGLTENDVIGLRVSMDRRTVRVEVMDPGPGFTIPQRDADSPQGSGWGLYLVDRLASRWGVDSADGNHVWFEVQRDGSRRSLLTV